ncbi:MAG: hypothetical protein HY791_30495 [Deltaproteobacteria bacterium]|nr:hypothetical protein [Deltaproteobacteria bacterium]
MTSGALSVRTLLVALLVEGCVGEEPLAHDGSSEVDLDAGIVDSPTPLDRDAEYDSGFEADARGADASGPIDSAPMDGSELDSGPSDRGPGPLSEALPSGGIRIRGMSTPLTRDATTASDFDEDGLTDSFEAELLEALRPVLVIAPMDPALTDGSAIQLVGRVFAASSDPLVVRALVMIGWREDYGSCGLTAHHGDSERFAVELTASAAKDLEITRIYTAAHEGTVTDRGRLFEGPGLAETVVGSDPSSGTVRLWLFPSERKHATYASVALCEGAFVLPCLRETCADESTGVLVVPPVTNAGEDTHRQLDALDALGFPGETAWGTADFCGGLGGSGCASPVRDKLMSDPFEP